MMISKIVQATGALLFAGALAGCVDVNMDMKIVDEENGIVVTEFSMDREFYDMSQKQGGGTFCEDDGVFEITDTVASCTTTKEGTFAELLEEAEGEPAPTITSVGPGLVRVAYPTASLAEEMKEDESDAESMAMMVEFFEGHTITLSVSGGEITDTNMVISKDGQSASLVIPFLDMIMGKADLPAESYAVVKLN
jgi:hypothetical protein